MDTSKIYQKMCDDWDIQIHRLKEIKNILEEGRHRWEEGDFYTIKRGLPAGTVLVWTDFDNIPTPALEPVWLPRQDQIQEMMGKCLPRLCLNFNFFVSENFWHNPVKDIYVNRKNEKISIGSFEQLWLTFYMWEKYKKVWTGEKWEKA